MTIVTDTFGIQSIPFFVKISDYYLSDHKWNLLVDKLMINPKRYFENVAKPNRFRYY